MPPNDGDKNRGGRGEKNSHRPPKRKAGGDFLPDIPAWLPIITFFAAPPLGIFLFIARAFKASSGDSIKRTSKRAGAKSRGKVQASQFLPLAIGAFFLIGALISISSVFTSGVTPSLGSFSTFALLAGAAAVALGVSKMSKRRAERYDRYSVIIGDRPYFSIAALAAASGVSYKRAARDIQHMINRDMLGDTAFIDVGKKMLFLSPEAAAEYENSHTAANTKDEKQFEDRVPVDEYRKIILEIRRLNDEIADIAVSDRIYKLEESTANIFDYVKEHPEKKSSIRTLMNYYLPTTLKLLGSYADIERVGVAGENMKKSKESIEKTLDMLVYAFNTELDRLYESETLDISGDIDVLEQMLKRDGMTRTSTSTASSASCTMAEEEHDEKTI